MSYEDWKRSSWPQWELHEAGEPLAQPLKSPGKRTLTMSLPPRSDSPLASGQTPVQQKADPAAVMQRKEQAARTEQWMDVVFRPDLYDAPVQRKSAGDKEGDQASTSLPADGGGKAMPEDVRVKMEGAFGTDFSVVRIHEGQQATAMGALAYTQGTDIHFAPGQYQPDSHSGQELLGHELTHVVQQSQGRVQATTQAKGVDVNDDVGLEREADEMGSKAARGETAAAAAICGSTRPGAGVVQRTAEQDDSTNKAAREKGPPVTSKEDAIKILTDPKTRDRINSSSSSNNNLWPNLPKDEDERACAFLNNLTQNVYNPDSFNQGSGTWMCGPSALLSQLLITNDPVGYVEMMIGIYCDGAAKYDNGQELMKLNPSEDIRATVGGFEQGKKYKDTRPLKDSPADQMLLATFNEKHHDYLNTAGPFIAEAASYVSNEELRLDESTTEDRFQEMAMSIGYKLHELANTEPRTIEIALDEKKSVFLFIDSTAWKNRNEAEDIAYENEGETSDKKSTTERKKDEKGKKAYKAVRLNHYIRIVDMEVGDDCVEGTYWDYGKKNNFILDGKNFRFAVGTAFAVENPRRN